MFRFSSNVAETFAEPPQYRNRLPRLARKSRTSVFSRFRPFAFSRLPGKDWPNS